MNHHICSGQIQTGTTSLERNKKYRCSIIIKGTHQFKPFLLRRFTGNRIVANAFSLQIISQKLQHRFKLRKNQYLMLACNRTLHHLQAQFPLSRSTFIITERQTRITANLTQTHQLCQNLYFALRKLFFTLRLHQFERFHNLPIIKSLLLGIKACDTHLFDFFRQFV